MSRQGIKVVEVGLRDGLQMVPTVVPTADKLAWIRAEAAAGISTIEVASFVPPARMPQMADAAAVVAEAKAIAGLHVSALVPNLKGAQAALAAGVDTIIVPVSASEAHSRANVRKTQQEMIDQVADIAAERDAMGSRTLVYAGIATAFGCTIQGEVPQATVERLAEMAVAAGADEVGLADTVGYANPEQVRRIFKAVRHGIGDRLTSAHFHDTRGLGLANVVAALEVGITGFDGSLGGLGGCPHAPGASGNIATEDLVFMLEAMGLDTGVDLDALLRAREIVARVLPGEPLHGRIAAARPPKTFSTRNRA